MTDKTQSHDSVPTPAELREKAEATREQLGQTVEALAGEADVKARMRQKTAETREQARQRAVQAKDKAAEALRAAQDRLPAPVTESTTQAKERIISATATVAGKFREKAPEGFGDKAGQVAQAARRRRGPLSAVAVVVLLVLVRKRRGRGRR
ncbi:DUF3618 domain-containing protein [Streptomyces roseolilacinus]|uniref:DUF3618 domain-containing protein n=1 Tax=Streptomyces roseolilacinus TaxID=66904 RepID=A0A918AWB5_9ACTN|nr:DUF3618 domain-containing protein [Streptomyces roseolilacinus]GGP93502.1 hypothetical protein GCM10010249_08970 [Streptomyces roseolilacinus]